MWRLIILAIIVSALGGFIWRWQYLESENDRLNTELNTANATVSALDQVNIRNNDLYNQERGFIDEIENSENTDDGPIAPVLMRTLNSIERVQDNGQ